MKFFQMKWIVPLILLAAFYLGDQIRLGRPDHKYRLTVTIDTPEGARSAASLLSVRPNRGYGGSGSGSSAPRTTGEAVLVPLDGSRSVVALLAYGDKGQDFEEPSFLPMRALTAEDKRVGFRDIKSMAGTRVSVPAGQWPVMIVFDNANNPFSARRITSDDGMAELGPGYRIASISVEIVAAGFWPLDFGGALGEPVTRSIAAHLPWLRDVNGAAKALQAVSITPPEGFTAEAAFAR